ncbi:MAG TPA: metal ABC transporter permease, partial [Acidimicrobiales bacterium]|nr:metal ABC transporter permease [Acidimicrobiales bacterium]
HALTEASATGGSGAVLAGADPLLGFVGGAVAGAAAMDAAGSRNLRGRDLGTGVVLGASIGLASLFLYLTTTTSATTGVTQTVLFGSIFVTGRSTLPLVVGLGALAMAVVALAYRPLLLSTVHPDLAAAAGARTRLVGLALMVALALAVGLSSLAVGAVLSTALLVGPAAAALRVARRMRSALLAAAGLGVGATWGGVLLAYDSADWGSSREPLPVSFFVVALVVLAYAICSVRSGRLGRRHGGGEAARPPA